MLKKINLKNLFENIAVGIFLVFLITVFIIANIYNLQVIKYNYYTKFSIIVVGISFFIPLLIARLNLPITDYQKKIWIPILLFIISFVIRYFVAGIIGVNSHQVSDFQKAFYYAQPERSFIGSEYETLPTWGFYAWILQRICSIFGYSEWAIIMVNVFLQAMSVVLIYYIAFLASNNNFKISMYAAIFYSIWPIHIFYNIILSPEHFYIFFSLLSILLVIIVIKKIKGIKAGLIVWGCAGSLLGIAGMFKALEKISLIAAFILIILEFIVSVKNRKKINWRYIISNKVYVIGFILMLVIYQLTTIVGYKFMDYIVGVPVNRNTLPLYLAVGLTSTADDGTGYYGNLYLQLTKSTNYDYKKVSAVLLKELKEEIVSKKHLNVDYFGRKFVITWGTSGYFYWLTETINTQDVAINPKVWVNIWFQIMQLYWVMIIGMCIVSTLYAFSSSNRNYLLLFSMIIIIGFAIFSIFIGVQDRYKNVLYPQFSILAGYGYYIIAELCFKIENKLCVSTRKGKGENI